MLPVELISDAANHHALKSLIVAFRNRAQLKVTLVKRSAAGSQNSSATCVLPYLIGKELPGPIFDSNEIARFVNELSSSSAASSSSSSSSSSNFDEKQLQLEQWFSYEQEQLSSALAPLYSNRRFTDEARKALKYLDSVIVANGGKSFSTGKQEQQQQEKEGSSSSSSSSLDVASLTDTILYASIFPAFCKDGILKQSQRDEFTALNSWFSSFESQNKSFVDAAQLELGAAEPADFLSVRPSYTLTPAQSKPFYVTTPIYYVNADPHIGHVYSTLIADTLAKYHRVKGEKAFFLTGTDEHGQKIAEAAEKLGKTPKEHTDVISNRFRTCFQQMGLGFDHFIRTTDPAHEKHVSELWKKLSASGDIILGSYEGWYCVSDEAYVTDHQVTDGVDRKTGQACKVSTESGNPVVRLREDNYVFKLSKYQDKLLKWYRENPRSITPEFRRQEIIKFVEGGLIDLSVSRQKKSCTWGIPVPGAENDHVIYVWLDALSNYLTYARLNQKDPENGELLPVDQAPLWPCDTHVIGKDILKFHAIYWPAFLLALGYPLPKAIVAHGWWTKDGDKISKSTGNTFDPVEKAKAFGLDALKFFLLKESGFNDDPDYSDSNMVGRLNSELADTLGNLHLRCISKKVNPEQVWPSPAEYSERDNHLIEHINDVACVVDHYFLNNNVHRALNSIFELLRDLNMYATENEPWKLVKNDKIRLGTVLFVMLEGLRICFTLLSPVLVESAPVALESLGVPKSLWTGTENLVFGVVKPGQALGTLPEQYASKGLFPKHDPVASSASSSSSSATAASAASSKK